MGKINFIFVFFAVLIFCLSFISSNFVCGEVTGSEDFSPVWTTVTVYFEENKSEFTECKVNPENKFCCDLENISSVEFEVGKKVLAEIIDSKRGFIAGPVSLYLTDGGYDVFPEINLEQAIKLNLPSEKIFIKESLLSLNMSSTKKDSSIWYSLNSSENYIGQELCANCTSSEFLIPLSKGKNELVLTIVGDKPISKEILIYNLDYLNFNIDFICSKCKKKKNFFYIPADEEIIVNLSFNSSHPISGDFYIYFPGKWVLLNPYNRDLSETHAGYIENIDNLSYSSYTYLIKTPKSFIKQNYIFYQRLNDNELLTKVRVFNLKLIPFYKNNDFKKEYQSNVLSQRTSVNEPIVLNPNLSYIKTIAIFPNQEIINSNSYLKYDSENIRDKSKSKFTIRTSLPKESIENIYFIFKVRKGESIDVKLRGEDLPLQFYEEDDDFTYYSASAHEKGPFEVRIS
jgi:hypothetical protein